MEERVLNAALAGLFHDIGKFAQRAGAGRFEHFNAETRKQLQYEHALCSHWFLLKYLPEDWRNDEDITCAAYHHHPTNQPAYWLQLADRLSSSEKEEDEDLRIPRQASIFSYLNGHRKPQFLPLTRLDPLNKRALFPEELKEQPWKDSLHQDAYAHLWQQFEEECEATGLKKISHKELYLETLLALLQEFTWCVPSASEHNRVDISLFDHARTTAAIAACLAADDRPVDWCLAAREQNASVLHLVGADISGIQSFIYTLSSSGAAKSLRARSFYVQLLCETLALYLLRELDLPVTNLIYVGGGGFEFLLPQAKISALHNVYTNLLYRLLEAHQGHLGLTVQSQEVRYADFAMFNQVRQALGEKLNRAKRRPFSEAAPEVLASIIGEPFSQGGDPLRFCSVTGEDGDTIQKDSEGNYKAEFVLSLEELGQLLPHASYIFLTPVKASVPERARSWQHALGIFGMDVRIAAQKPPSEKISDLVTRYFTRVWRLKPEKRADELDILRPFGLKAYVIGYRPLAQLTPLNAENHVKTFNELAVPMQGNFKRWGVLRCDVDNLGEIFQHGLGEHASLARLANLSFALRLFFEGWLPCLANAGQAVSLSQDEPGWEEDLSPYLYLQYSGGDDLFLVGAWDALPRFAWRVHASFKKYVAGNPGLTLSAGISLVEEKFPLYQAALQAGVAESKAKSFVRTDGKSKDAITFLDYPLDWEDFNRVWEQASHLAEGIRAGRLPKSLVQTLLGLNAQISFARQRGKKPTFGAWTWMAAYQLTRLVGQVKDEQERQYLSELRNTYLIPNPKTETLGLAARWADFLTRGA